MNLLTRIVLIAISSILLAATGAQATLDWPGGTNDWTTGNWWYTNGTTTTVSGWPGDATYAGERADMENGGLIRINAGDDLNPGMLYYYGDMTVEHTGGDLLSAQIYYMRPRYEFTGGWLLPSIMRISHGGVLYMNGGQFGDRVIGGYLPSGYARDTKVEFREGTFDIHGGTVDVHTVNMPGQQQAGNVTVVRATGTDATLSALYLDFSSIAGATSQLEYVFSDAGISGWGSGADQSSGGASTTLGTGDTAGNLWVDVGDYASDGTEWFSLINYSSLAGAFGSVTVTDSVQGATLLSGTAGSLGEGEYALDYTGTAGDGSEVMLSFNNIPEPSAIGMLLLGGLAVWLRRRGR